MADVKENKNPQGFYFNQQMCIGCRTCQVACKDKNDLEVGYLFRRVESFEVGEFPAPATFHYSGACNHCHTPACVEVCPAGATYINEEDGTVQHDDEACIGCGYCVKACPLWTPGAHRGVERRASLRRMHRSSLGRGEAGLRGGLPHARTRFRAYRGIARCSS